MDASTKEEKILSKHWHIENIKSKFYKMKEEKREIILLTSSEQFYNVLLTGMYSQGFWLFSLTWIKQGLEMLEIE